VNTEVSEAPWKPEHRLVRIGLQGPRIAAERLPPANLTFLIDVSGSMNGPKRLPLLKQSFRLLIDELRPQDRVSMVVYAGAAGVVLPPTEGSEKARIIEALEALQAGGSTAGAEGIRLAYQTARASFVRGGNNRVILATDGDFNVGTSSDAELVQLIEQERKSGVFLTILGFGMGNYQDAKMQKLADAGNGHHAYIDDLDEARKTLVAEMGATLLTVAKDMKVQVEFNPARVKAYRLIGYENRRLADADFNNDQKDAGELGAGHSVTVLYELIPAGSSEEVSGIDPLKYQAVAPTAAAGGDELLTVKLRYKAPDADTSRLHSQALVDTHTPLAQTSDDFRFAAAVAEFGMLLRESPHRGTASFGSVLTRAQVRSGPQHRRPAHRFPRGRADRRRPLRAGAGPLIVLATSAARRARVATLGPTVPHSPHGHPFQRPRLGHRRDRARRHAAPAPPGAAFLARARPGHDSRAAPVRLRRAAALERARLQAPPQPRRDVHGPGAPGLRAVRVAVRGPAPLPGDRAGARAAARGEPLRAGARRAPGACDWTPPARSAPSCPSPRCLPPWTRS
jgi:Ca-activated chloride channel family protein